MPRLRAVWAVAQACLALATAAWGLSLLATTHRVEWAAGNLAAAIFFLVTVFLFAANHDDGRVVGVFGLMVFIVTNVLLIYAVVGGAGSAATPFDPPEAIPNLEMGEGWTRAQMAGVFAGAAMLIAVPQALLLLFGHGTPRWARRSAAETPPPM